MKKIYTIIIFILAFSQVHALSNPAGGLKEISLTGLTTNDGYTFHIYSADGKLNRGFSEIFIALTDENNNFVSNFTVSDFRPLFDKNSSQYSTPIGNVEKVEGKSLYKTWFSFLTSGNWSLSFNYTIGTKKSSIIGTTSHSYVSKKANVLNDTITQIGWFKDRCPFCIGGGVGSVTVPLLKSCGIGCGTGSGGMAGCWNSGLGLFIYNLKDTGKITRDTAISDSHYLLGDAQSKELIRAFLLSLPSAASGKISVKVTGYWLKNGISANKLETFVPEIIPDSIDHYLDAFHLLSIEGIYIDTLANSYSGFATKSYKLTPQDLAPSKLFTLFDTEGVTVKFAPPANEGNAKSNLKGYKIRVYNNNEVIQNQFTATSNDTTARTFKISGLKASDNFSFSVAALYPTSTVEVESEQISAVDTFVGWFKDRDCVWGPGDSVALPLQSSCWVSCGTGTGDMASCFESGLGVFIYNPKESGKISIDSAQSSAHYLLGDPQSKELIRAFLEQLPFNAADQSSPADQKISVKVTGYWVKNGISANKSETYVPEISSDSVIHRLDAFHYLSIEGVVFPNDTNSFSGFATNSYKLTPQDLAPKVLWAANYTGGTTVKFIPPANEGNLNSNVTGYKARVYSKDSVLQDKYTTIKNDTTLRNIDINGLTANSDYKFSVAALYPVSGVEVESALSNVKDSSITGIVLSVDDYPANNRWIDSFTFNNSNYFLSVANPKSLAVGSQTVKAYINKQADVLQPFPVVDGGFKIVPTPFMRSMGHGSSGNTDLVWNSTDSVDEGTLKFSMDGDWRVNLKIYDAIADTLIAGVDLNENGDNSTHYWDFYLETMDTTGIKNIKQNGILVYPTLSQGEITIVSPAEARIKVIGLTGQTIGYYQSSGSKTIQLNAPSGLYFVLVESSGKIFTQKVIIKK
jgi:hypothetical protein